jgi:hypothetical protein
VLGEVRFAPANGSDIVPKVPKSGVRVVLDVEKELLVETARVAPYPFVAVVFLNMQVRETLGRDRDDLQRPSAHGGGGGPAAVDAQELQDVEDPGIVPGMDVAVLAKAVAARSVEGEIVSALPVRAIKLLIKLAGKEVALVAEPPMNEYGSDRQRVGLREQEPGVQGGAPVPPDGENGAGNHVTVVSQKR